MMGQASVGVFVDGSPEAAVRLQLAHTLAQARSARVRALVIEAIWTPKNVAQKGSFVEPGAPAGSNVAAIVRPRDGALAIERIRVNADAAARAAASLAHGLDLVIFAQPERLHTSLLEAQIAAGLIALAGRPSLMVPRRSAPIWPPRRVLLAWDGRAGASRAAFGALDIMREAQSVLILAVDRLNGAGRKLEAPIALDEVAAWLLAHGVKAESLRLQSTAEPAHVVCAALRDHAIDLAVMGGYGRVGGDDLMIGSTTAATLAQVEAPVLFGG